MKNVSPAWPRGTFRCDVTEQLAFETSKDAGTYFGRYCGTGQSLTRVWQCERCNGWHFESQENDENGKRPQTLKIPTQATATGRRLSARDTEKFNAL